MIGVSTLILVFLAWFIFGAIFLLRKRPPKAEEIKRVAAAKWGIALLGAGFALVRSFHRAYWWPFAPSRLGELALAAAAVVQTGENLNRYRSFGLGTRTWIPRR